MPAHEKSLFSHSAQNFSFLCHSIPLHACLSHGKIGLPNEGLSHAAKELKQSKGKVKDKGTAFCLHVKTTKGRQSTATATENITISLKTWKHLLQAFVCIGNIIACEHLIVVNLDEGWKQNSNQLPSSFPSSNLFLRPFTKSYGICCLFTNKKTGNCCTQIRNKKLC